MNKKGQIAMLRPFLPFAVYLLFGIGVWLISSSIREMFISRFGFSNLGTLIMGVVIVVVIFISYKFKLHNLVPR